MQIKNSYSTMVRGKDRNVYGIFRGCSKGSEGNVGTIGEKITLKEAFQGRKAILNIDSPVIKYLTKDELFYEVLSNLEGSFDGYKEGHNGNYWNLSGYDVIDYFNAIANKHGVCMASPLMIDETCRYDVLSAFDTCILGSKKGFQGVLGGSMGSKGVFNASNTRYRIVPLFINKGPSIRHQNVLLVDQKLKIIEHFEPAGSNPLEGLCSLENILQRHYSTFTYMTSLPHAWQNAQEQELLPTEVHKVGFCVPWCALYVDLRLGLSKYGPYEILNEVTEAITNYKHLSGQEGIYSSLIMAYLVYLCRLRSLEGTLEGEDRYKDISKST